MEEKKATYQRPLLVLFISILVIAEGFCGYKLHTLSGQRQVIKKDYSVVNNISLGLLSVSQWRDLIVSSVEQQIQDFKFTKPQHDSLKKEIDQILYGLVDKADSMINHPKTFGGKVKKVLIKAFVNKDDLKKQVPGFSQKILSEVEKPSSKKRLKSVAQSKLQELGNETYDSTKDAQSNLVDSVFKKYKVTDEDAFEKNINATLSQLTHDTYLYAFGMLAVIILILFTWWLIRNQKQLHTSLFILSIFSAGILLLVGLSTTMFEIDARIKSLDFHLLGQTISFKNQILYFQSKSILDIVRILVHTHKYDSVFVGVLILAFSVIFPFSKLISTGIHLLGNEKWANHKVVKFFAFHSGKWSMADVMVVAIFMAYIGFNGILNDQLSDLNVNDDTMTSISTNETTLQPGYIVFVAFVLYGLLLSQILKQITKYRNENRTIKETPKPKRTRV